MFPCCVKFGSRVAGEDVIFDIAFETSLFVGYDMFCGGCEMAQLCLYTVVLDFHVPGQATYNKSILVVRTPHSVE